MDEKLMSIGGASAPFRRLGLLLFVCCLVLSSGGCGPRKTRPAGPTVSLAQARQGHVTKLTRQIRAEEAIEKPPTSEFSLVRYPSPAGELAAYVSGLHSMDKKHPAIIWIFGGFDNGIGATAWENATPDNDQSARAFRDTGVITMFPSFRGGNDNPGFREGFYGEVDDVIAAAKWLAQQPYVDPQRIYLGGHSTGGTLALLVAESTGGFRAVFSFGPVSEVVGYGPDELPFDIRDTREAELRSPVRWINAINRPTFVFEGTSDGNLDAVREIASASSNPLVQCYAISGADHFSVLAQLTPVIAQQILNDTGPDVKMTFPGRKL
jgi:dipeptidyl aminopeptidase/acylaminoacyl peptidase